MSRKPINRKVACRPGAAVFKPAGVPAAQLERVVLPLDCYEAIRLADLEGLSQEEVAQQLGVSRPTVSRILEKGRRLVAEALVEGKAIVLEGGPVRQVVPRRWGWRHGRCWEGFPRPVSPGVPGARVPFRGAGRIRRRGGGRGWRGGAE